MFRRAFVVGVALALALFVPLAAPASERVRPSAQAAGRPHRPIASTTGARANALSPRPNIVIFYLDDVNPHDGRLWSDPSLTPALQHYFVEQGTEFSAAIGETPLCCPGRAGLLTSLHTHNHGVKVNDARLLQSRQHIGRAMRRAGYASMFIGKYLNRNNYLTSAQWRAHGAGWTHLDVIKGYNGRFYDYKVWTKTGLLRYDDTHSTRMVAERAVARIRQLDADVPIFAILSVYNLHAPNTPMPEFANDERCSSMPAWRPPSYDEADVSDKHPYVRAQPRLTASAGWPMGGYCREMLGVDWLVDLVTDELAAQGRLDNTLLVFTADNGSTWGAHRLAQKKLVPYATRVPLYMWWPSQLGTLAKRIGEPVSNIDLGPTFCEIAGCRMGPYPTSEGGPDGTSLLPLITGAADSLERQGVLETAWSGTRTWAAVRTGESDPLGAWHYVAWKDGFRELYELESDPWQLENRASDTSLSAIRAALAKRLAELRHEGTPSR